MRKVMIIPILFTVISSFNCKIQAQVCKAPSISALIKLAKEDRAQKIERLAALKFHKLINDYRKENKLASIEWDEALWLASRNHNFWMDENSTLSHTEKKGTKCFSGTKPGSRYMYATVGKGNASWSGENILYHYKHDGKNINEIATTIAKNALVLWQGSPGHNDNMLGESHKAHGVAFHFGKDGRIYSTDLFASSFDDQFSAVKQKNKKKA